MNSGAETSVIWDAFNAAQNYKANAGTHGFHYVNHTEYAMPGRIHITPFMNALDSALSKKVLPLVNPNPDPDSRTFITNRTDTPTGSLDNVFDGNASTEIVFKSPNTPSEGDYVGIRYTQPKEIHEIHFLLGHSSNLNDTFSKAKVQITTNGSTWTDLDDTVYTSPQEICLTDLSLKIRGVRVIATEAKSNTLFGVRDILINPEHSDEWIPDSEITLAEGCTYYTGSARSLMDGDNSTVAHIWTRNNTAEVGPLITRTFSEPVTIGSIVYVNGDGSSADKFTDFALEYTEDGTNWIRAAEYTSADGDKHVVHANVNGKTVKAIRVNNLERINKWIKTGGLDVTLPNEIVMPESEITLGEECSYWSGNAQSVLDGNNETFAWIRTPGNAAQVGVLMTRTFAEPVELGSVTFVNGDGSEDKLTDFALEYTLDGTNWIRIDEYQVPAGGQDTITAKLNGKRVKAFHVYNLKKVDKWIKVAELAAALPGETPLPDSSITLASGCGYYQGNLIDGKDTTFAWIRTPGDSAEAGVFMTRTFNEPVALQSMIVLNGAGTSADKLTDFALEYSEDGKIWHRLGSHQGKSSGMDTVSEPLYGKKVKAIRINNLSRVDKWVQVTELGGKADDSDVYVSSYLLGNQSRINATTIETEDGRKLTISDSSPLVLKPGKYAGLDLGEISKISSLNVRTLEDALTVDVSRNGYEWTEVAAYAASVPDARYVRLINKTDAETPVGMETPLEVHTETITGPYLLSDTLGITAESWAADDTRNFGGAFDGNVESTIEFAVLPETDGEIIFDLGQLRSISKLEIFNKDDVLNYIRDAKVQISADKQNWTDVFEIGDGQENTHDADVMAKDSDAGYGTNSTYPNYMTKSDTFASAQDAR